MEKIVKAIKFGGIVNTLIGDMLDRIIAEIEFVEEFKTFMDKYIHEHPDEIDNIYFVFKFYNPSFSVIMNREKISLITNPREKFFNDQEPNHEVMKKRLQSGEDEILYRNKFLQPEEDEEHN